MKWMEVSFISRFGLAVAVLIGGLLEAHLAFLETQGFRVLRYWNNDVMNKIKDVINEIRGVLEETQR
jgi:hypothetical protein